METRNNIKKLIYNLYQIVEKSSNNLILNNIDDCAKVITKIHGYSSWKHFLKDTEPVIVTKITDQIYNKPNYYDINYQKKQLNYSKRYQQKYNFELKKTYMKDVLIGFKNNKLKGKELISIKLENTIIFSSNTTNKIFLNILKDINSNKQYNIQLISNKQKNPINPLSIIYYKDNLEKLLNPIENEFMFHWLNTIHQLINEHDYSFNFKELKELLKLDEFINFLQSIENVLNIDYFKIYIKKIFNKDLSELNLITIKSQHIHFENIKYAMLKLENIEKLYNEGFCSYNETSIFEKFSKNKTYCYYQIENADLKSIWNELISIEIHTLLDYISKQCEIENKYINNYNLYLFCDNIESWNNDYYHLTFKSNCKQIINNTNNSETISKIHHLFEQIIFLKFNKLILPLEIKDKMLLCTKEWNFNIWYNNMQLIEQLSDNEGFLWKKKTNHELSTFYIEKFNFLTINDD